MVLRRIIGFFTGDPERADYMWRAVDDARNWTLAIVIVFIAIKAALIATESSIVLKWYEWFLAPAAFSYQHLFASIPIFVVFWLVFCLANLRRSFRYVAIVLLSIAQLSLTFMHIASLRVEHILRTYPTFEMTQADAEASIFTSSVLDPSNLPYTLSGLGLTALAVVAPLLLFRFLRWRPVRASWRRWLLVFVIWVGAGAACEAGLRSDVGVAASDPVIYYFADLIDKAIDGTSSRSRGTTRKYDVMPLYGDKRVVETSHLFENLDAWRKTKKNVVLIVLESSPYHQMSFMGPVKVGKETRDTTPNLRKLRKNMLILENHYTVHPTSMNALFSIGCSLYPYPGGGIITNINPRIPCHSISEMFADAKYKTALFHSGKFSFWAKRKFYDNRGFSLMKDARTMPGKENAPKFKWGIEEFTTARAVSDFIQKNKKRSFYIEYIPVFPHVPYDHPDGDFAIYPDARPRDMYHNSVRYADQAVQIVIDGIKKAHLLKDTLVIVVGDHGEAFLEHRGNRVHSIYIYEENVHVGALFYNPLLFPSQRSTERVTSHIDFLPTIADLVGLPHGQWWQGHSLLENIPSPLTYFFASWGPELVGVRDGRYKAIYDWEKKKFELFDLVKDPHEKKNLGKKLSGREGRYRRSLLKWRDYHMELIPKLGK